MNLVGVRFPPTASKSNNFCSVFGCNSRKCKDLSLTFHRFPKAGESMVDFENKLGIKESIDRRILWERVLKMGKDVTQNMFVCSLHFTKDDYSFFTGPDYPAKARFLKKSAVPSVNLPKSSVEVEKQGDDSRKIRLEQRAKKLFIGKKDDLSSNSILTENESNSTEKGEIFTDGKKTDDNLEDTAVSIEKLTIQDNIEELEKKSKDAETQVTSGDLIDNYFFNILKTDQALSTATGISNFQLFNNIVASVEIAAPQLKNHTGVLGVRDRVLITFLKLKQNLSYAFLSLLFPSVSVRYCSDIICNMIDILCEILRPYIHFPSNDEIIRNIPHCFDNYSDTRIILDCTEIEIQKPKNLCCQIATYSHYKGRNTIKFMTGVTPGGIISFVSKAYGGRASDKSIFEQSRLVEYLDANSAIMVDKGFLIDEMCFDRNIKLIRPSFLRTAQFSTTDAVETANIASARVHVERLNQRIKVFSILGGKMSSCLLAKSEKIMLILCAIVNLSAPIFKDDKFNM